MRYRFIDEDPSDKEPDSEQAILAAPPPPRDPSLRFGYFYSRSEFLLMQCLVDYCFAGTECYNTETHS